MKTNSFMFFRTFIRSKLWIHAPHDSPFCLDSMSQRSWKSADSTQKIRIHTYPHTFSRNFPGIEVPCRLQRILQLILRFTLRLEHMAGKPKTKAPGRFRWSDPNSGHPQSQSLWIDVDGHFSEWLLAQTFRNGMTQMQYDIIWHHMTSYDIIWHHMTFTYLYPGGFHNTLGEFNLVDSLNHLLKHRRFIS